MKQNQKTFLAGRRIGIDKLILRLGVRDIDYIRLKSTQADISYYGAGRGSTLRDDCGMPVQRIVIKDNQIFSDLCIGCYSNGETICEYAYLTLTVSQARGGNVQNMSWTEYDYYLMCVVDYIADQYGVILDVDQATIKSIEINCNIALSCPYVDYRRVLAVLSTLAPKTLKTASEFSEAKQKGKEATHIRQNKQMGLVLYNKTAQARKNNDVPEDEEEEKHIELLRVELRLYTHRKIKEVFGTTLWRDLDDRIIVDYYFKTLEKWWIKGAEKWKARCAIDLKKRFRAARGESIKNWHHILIHGLKNDEIRTQLPIVLDIEQIIDAIRQSGGSSATRSHRVSVIKRTKSPNDVFWNRDWNKLLEILEGVKEAYQRSLEYAGQDTQNLW